MVKDADYIHFEIPQQYRNSTSEIQAMDIFYSSPLLRQIRPTPLQSLSLTFWAAHGLTDGEQVYTYYEQFQIAPDKLQYQDRPPQLLNPRQPLDKEQLRQRVIRKVQWATQRKLNQGFSPVLELNQKLLNDLEPATFKTVLEEAKEAATLELVEWGCPDTL